MLPNTMATAQQIGYSCIVTRSENEVVNLVLNGDKAEAQSAYANYCNQADYDGFQSSGYQDYLTDGSICLQLVAPDGSLLSKRYFDNSTEPIERNPLIYCCNYASMAGYKSLPIASNRSQEDAMAAFEQCIATATANGVPNSRMASALGRPTHVLRVFGRANVVLATWYFDESETQETAFPDAYGEFLLAEINKIYPELTDGIRQQRQERMANGASGTRANGVLVDILVANGAKAVDLLKTFQAALAATTAEEVTETVTSPEPTKLTPGCYFDSAQGFANNGQAVIALAKEHGWVDKDEVLDENGQADTDDEFFHETVDAATNYLSNLAPDGHYADWYDGDYGVWAITYKENQFRYVVNCNERGEFSADFYRISTETGEDEEASCHHIDTDEAAMLAEEGVCVTDGESVADYYHSLDGSFGKHYTILEESELVQEDESSPISPY